MKFAFICGSLEAGRDGVGDYIQNLACELKNQGHQVAILAINDRHISDKMVGLQGYTHTDIQVLRLPARWSVKTRFIEAKKFSDKFDPDYMSLQFVPYSFNLKGLTLGLGEHLKRLSAGRHCHIMVHELWVGMDRTASLKNIGLGMIQKHLICSMIKKLKPKVIHTQSRLYQLQLDQIGFETKYLPLFSNILKTCDEKGTIGNSEMEESIKEIKLVIFGSIHPGAPVAMLAKEVQDYSKNTEVNICLVLIGLCGTEQDHWVATWRSYGLRVQVMGEQPSNVISRVLSSASLGITTTPAALADKSGSVAAMLEHRIPVLVVSRTWQPKGFPIPDLPSGIHEYQEGNFANLIDNKLTFALTPKVSEVANKFIEGLSN